MHSLGCFCSALCPLPSAVMLADALTPRQSLLTCLCHSPSLGDKGLSFITDGRSPSLAAVQGRLEGHLPPGRRAEQGPRRGCHCWSEKGPQGTALAVAHSCRHQDKGVRSGRFQTHAFLTPRSHPDILNPDSQPSVPTTSSAWHIVGAHYLAMNGAISTGSRSL